MDIMKLTIFYPRKDQCDTCFKFKNENLSETEYNDHIMRKDVARSEKERDKKEAIEGKVFVITMDVQSVKLSPSYRPVHFTTKPNFAVTISLSIT